MIKYVLQMIAGISIFSVSTFFAWYEGSGIVEDSFEWKYSTPFTNLKIQEITNGGDISQFDYFVYAVKFQPLFPLIMLGSLLYVLSVIGFYLINRKSKWAIPFWGILGLLLLVFSVFISTSFTIGNSIFFGISFISGLYFITVAFFQYTKNVKHQNKRISNGI